MNKKFTENWLKILEFNSNVEILEDSKLKVEKARIPLTPIEIKTNLLYYLFKLLYPKFINDQQNILDIIISKDGNEVLKVIIYKTKIVGIHETLQTLPNNIIDFQLKYMKNLDEFDEQFSRIQTDLISKTGTRFSSVRIFKEGAIDALNKYCQDIEKGSFFEFLNRFFDLVQELFEKRLFYIYPKPNIYKFFEKGIELLNKIKITTILQFLNGIFLEFNTAFVLNSEKFSLILNFIKEPSRDNDSKITFNIYTFEDMEINLNELSIEESLHIIQRKLNTTNVYFLSQNSLLNLLSDFFELDIPIEQARFKLLLQKFLFGFRSFEHTWYMVPRPKIYNSLNRFLVRLLGFNINFKKLSHWAIPDLFFNLFDSYFGLNYRLLLIFTSLTKTNGRKADYLNYAFENALLLEVENKRLVSINPINKTEFMLDSIINKLDTIHAEISAKYGYISAVMNIDKSLLNSIIGSFGIKLSKYRPFSKSKAFKMLKKEQYFNVYPELPPFKLIKQSGMISLLKMILPIIIDKHEF